MRNINHILAVIDRSEDVSQVLNKTRFLAEANDADIHVVRVIYEGITDFKGQTQKESAQLKGLILEAEEINLANLCEGINNTLQNVESFAMWNAKTWEGILHAAVLVDADLIVRSAYCHNHPGVLIRTPDDWNLLRHSEVPVMLVGPQAWKKCQFVLAALDVFDDDHEALNIEILRSSSAYAKRIGGKLHIVCTYPLFEPWATEFGAVTSYEELKQSIELDIAHRVERLCSKACVSFHMLYAEEGRPAYAISRVSNEADADVLFVGTKARQGIKGIILGNTSEHIIHSTSLDVITIHEPQGT